MLRWLWTLHHLPLLHVSRRGNEHGSGTEDRATPLRRPPLEGIGMIQVVRVEHSLIREVRSIILPFRIVLSPTNTLVVRGFV